jgi:ketosteroid isomerase-like protein
MPWRGWKFELGLKVGFAWLAMALERAPEIEELLRRAYVAHQQGDPGPMTELISGEADVVALGSDPAERFPGPEAIADMLAADAQGRAGAPMRATIEQIVAYREGTVAWSVADIAFRREQGGDVPFRATAVLHLEDGGWKVVLWTVSLLVRNEAMEAAWPATG